MKINFNIPWYFKLMTASGCILMMIGILELYLKFLPDSLWKYTPFACIVLGVFMIIPQHFLSLMEILKYRPKNED